MDDEKRQMTMILGHTHKGSSSPTGGPQVVNDTPSAMQTHRDRLKKKPCNLSKDLDLGSSDRSDTYGFSIENEIKRMAGILGHINNRCTDQSADRPDRCPFGAT